jgi:hypothetical protein
MYQYDQYDQTLVDERVAQFRGQVRRYLAGELSDDEFRPLRLMNGLYLQRHAPMLRVAIPYGLLSSRQLRALARIARRYDRGFGHFTTRQNIQYNWPKLEETPDILAELAQVDGQDLARVGRAERQALLALRLVDEDRHEERLAGEGAAAHLRQLAQEALAGGAAIAHLGFEDDVVFHVHHGPGLGDDRLPGVQLHLDELHVVAMNLEIDDVAGWHGRLLLIVMSLGSPDGGPWAKIG